MQNRTISSRKRRSRKKHSRSNNILFDIYNNALFRLVGKYIISISVFAVLFIFLDGSLVLQRFYDLNALLTGTIANIFLSDIVIKNDVVYASTFGLKIVSECTSIAPTAILISGIIAFPSNLSQKLTGAVVGIIVLGFLNLIRTSSLLYIGSIYPSVFETAHILVWQSLMIATAIFLWLLWWKYLVNNNFSLKL